MPDPPHNARSVTLSLSLAEQWTLHHVLLDRIERETKTAEPTSVDPPPVELFQAFETLDAGVTSFTVAQLEAMQPILAEYHHSTEWETDRPRLEQLLHSVSDRLEQDSTALPAD